MGKSIVLAANSVEFSKKKLIQIKESLRIKENNFSDQFEINASEDRASIGIKQMQELKDWSKTKPYSGTNKLAVINTAELLTIEAQNSVLKMLEEPNNSICYVLVTSNHFKLLPTVLSRCELIIDPNWRQSTFEIGSFLEFDQLDKFKYLQRFEKFEDISEKHQEIESFLLALLHYFRNELLSKNLLGKDSSFKAKTNLSNDILSNNIKVIQLVKKMCDAKVSTKNALDYLVINVKFA